MKSSVSYGETATETLESRLTTLELEKMSTQARSQASMHAAAGHMVAMIMSHDITLRMRINYKMASKSKAAASALSFTW